MGAYLFTLPPFLQGIIEPAGYNYWVRIKAWDLLKRDRKRKFPYALLSTVNQYKEAIHDAVMQSSSTDPYSGDTLVWRLIGTWDPNQAKKDPQYEKQFYLMPTIDHINPYANFLAFEICSWEINAAKSFLNPSEFVSLCDKIVTYRNPGQLLAISTYPPQDSSTPVSINSSASQTVNPTILHPLSPTHNPLSLFLSKLFNISTFKLFAISFFDPPLVYPLPNFLQGICSQNQYGAWLLLRAKELYNRDKKNCKVCALHSSRSLYRKAIHAAVNEGDLFDPYTRDVMDWQRIGTWDSTTGKDNHDIFRKEFTMLPTVDHKDPEMKALDFEICSWLINCCKSGRTPQEFIALCKRVASYCARM